jgi:hypothetical protein
MWMQVVLAAQGSCLCGDQVCCTPSARPAKVLYHFPNDMHTQLALSAC